MSAINSVPFLDLVTAHHNLKDELCGAFRSAIETASFIGGPLVEEFERQFAAYCKTDYCVGVGSGTDALRFALIASGVCPGDTVLTVPNSFIATGEAISQAGAIPDFVDVDERTYNMDPLKLKEYLETSCYWNSALSRLVVRRSGSPLTAIVPVHLYGQPADMDPIADLAEQYNLILLEDACQAHGADYFSERDGCWKRAGSMGMAAAFSFYPGKNLGACGEAGAVTTNDPELARKIRMLRDHGQIRKYYHEVEGYNGRLDAIQASILLIKLKYLDDWTLRRRKAASRYGELLDSPQHEIMLPYQPDWAQAVYHLFVVCVRNREQLMKQLSLAGIGTGIHYPIPLHLQRAYNHLGYSNGDFPVSERLSDEVLSLPMGPELTAAQQERVAEEVLKSVELRPLMCAAAAAG
jgi:dTDP-4-amino-4,6-dideoxygalactose transaminase